MPIFRHQPELLKRYLAVMALEKYAEKELGIKGLNVQIACGYAEYDIKTDKNFEDTRSRADKKMYESKRRLKRE